MVVVVAFNDIRYRTCIVVAVVKVANVVDSSRTRRRRRGEESKYRLGFSRERSGVSYSHRLDSIIAVNCVRLEYSTQMRSKTQRGIGKFEKIGERCTEIFVGRKWTARTRAARKSFIERWKRTNCPYSHWRDPRSIFMAVIDYLRSVLSGTPCGALPKAFEASAPTARSSEASS